MPKGRRYPPPRQRRQGNVNQSFEVADQYEYTSQCLVACQLFFKATDEKGKGLQEDLRKKLVPPPGTLEALACANVTFPFTVPLLERQDDENYQKQQRVDKELASSSFSRTTASSHSSYSLTIRRMIVDDINSAILPMCVEEFGLGPTTSILDLGSSKTWRTQRTLANWWDRFTMEPMVSLALTTKIWLQERTTKATTNLASVNGSGSSNRFSDPTLLVLCLNEHHAPQRRSVHDKTKHDTNAKASATDAPRTTVIGMIEWSFQPPEASRNPPGFPPIPLWMKQLYCQLFPDGLSDPTVQGWITNLLIHPDHRGYGYSKLLVSAVEGVARSFNTPNSSISCQAIYLHADADIQGGRIPQALYEGMGYELIVESRLRKQQQEQWGRATTDSMSDDGFQMFFDSRIHMVDGAPLLFYCKRLDKRNVEK
jgi:GNAT superfamily N-acetyltransferase